VATVGLSVVARPERWFDKISASLLRFEPIHTLPNEEKPYPMRHFTL
jgi:hypothetical protein